MNQPKPLFRLFSVFSKQTSIQFLQQINVKIVNSIQYTVPGFEPMTFPLDQGFRMNVIFSLYGQMTPHTPSFDSKPYCSL